MYLVFLCYNNVGDYMKNILKEHSPYLIFLNGFEIVFSIISIISFVYRDLIEAAWINDLSLLISNVYSQTWWGFVLLIIGLIAIFTLTCIVYKKLEYLFISIACWVLLFILAINLNNSFGDIIITSLLFIPIIIINIIAYKKEKEKINPTNKKNLSKR